MKHIAWIAALGFALCHCNSDDTGKACKGSTGTYPSTTVQGENTSQGLVSVSTDAVCNSFNCVTDQGLPSFCSRSCTVAKAASNAKTCAVDSDCAAPAQCDSDGICKNDDCPAGYWCKIVQPVGPYAKQPFCIQRTGCKNDYDCGSIGVNTCQNLGCYDSCDGAPSASCAQPQVVCKPKSELKCACNNNAATCPDANLVCEPPSATAPLAAGAVTSKQVCLPKS